MSPASVRRSRITTVATGETPGGDISSPFLNKNRSGAGPMALNICCSSHLSEKDPPLLLEWKLFLRATSGRVIFPRFEPAVPGGAHFGCRGRGDQCFFGLFARRFVSGGLRRALGAGRAC